MQHAVQFELHQNATLRHIIISTGEPITEHL